MTTQTLFPHGSVAVPVYQTDDWCPVGHFNPDQADFYAEVLGQLRPTTAVEVGFGTGRSAASVLHAADGSLRKMVSIEQNLDFISPLGRPMAARLADRFQGFRVIEGWSRDVLVDGFLASVFPDGIDFATVDGEHDFAGCTFDLTAVAPHICVGGMIAVDDYRSGPPNGVAFPEVDRAVDEFRDRHRTTFDARVWHAAGKGMCLFTRRAAD